MIEAADRRFRSACSQADRQLIGSGIASLILFSNSWVHRRVETVSFVDTRTLVRQFSIDCSLPNDPPVAVQQELLPVVPLARLKKRKLASFSAWEENSCPLPVLTASENGWISAQALLSIARAAADTAGLGSLPESIEGDLIRLASGPAHGVGGAPGAFDLLDRLKSGEGPNGAYAQTLMNNPLLAALAGELAEQFVLYVPLRDRGRSRRVIKFSYEQVLTEVREASQPISVHGIRQRARLRFSKARAWIRRRGELLAVILGWRSRTTWLDALAVGDSHSYHLEIVTPPELEARSGYLAAFSGAEITSDSDRVNSRRVHMNVSGFSHQAVGVGRIRLRADRDGMIWSAWLLTLVMSIVFLIGRERSAALLEDKSASILLAVPSLLAAYLARPEEHRITRQVLLGTRILIILVGLCSFVGAAVLQLGFSACEVGETWRVLSFIGLVCLGLLTITVLTCLWQAAIRARNRGDSG